MSEGRIVLMIIFSIFALIPVCTLFIVGLAWIVSWLMFWVEHSWVWP